MIQKMSLKKREKKTRQLSQQTQQQQNTRPLIFRFLNGMGVKMNGYGLCVILPATLTVFVAFALCNFNGRFSCNMRYQKVHENVFTVR